MPQITYAERNHIDVNQVDNFLAGIQHLSREDWNRLKQDKENFLNNYSELPNRFQNIYQPIANSWIKSHNSGIKIQSQALKRPFLNSEELNLIQEKNHVLIEYTKPLFRNFKKIVSSSYYTFHLFDKDGILILNEGTIPSRFPALAPARGTIWNEDIVGTNACSVSIEIKRPVVLPGFLHYSDIFNNLIASACPIFYENGEVAGYLGCVQPSKEIPGEENYQKEISQALGLIITMESSVESKLKLAKMNETLKMAYKKFEVASSLNDIGIITIDHTGKITATNQVASKMLRQKSASAMGKNIKELLKNHSNLLDVVKTGEKADVEEKICVGKNEQTCLINIRPVIDESTNSVSEAVLKINLGKNTPANKCGFTTRFSFEDLIGESKELRKAIEIGERYANTSENILLIGESGTGKELFAQAIHNKHSANGPFIAVNCAAMPKDLIESELFGYEGGSFTGAERSGRPGKIELANGGTLLLDEIGDMPLELQAVLLRVLEDKQVMRVGGQRYHKIDFRMVAATNKDLYKMVKEGKFREDLYFRLSILTINLSPLRQRGDDVEILANYFIEKHCSKLEIPTRQISTATMKILKEYDWPGNVRQLENAIISAINTEKGDVIEPESLPTFIRSDSTPKASVIETLCKKNDMGFTLRNWERNVIEAALASTENFVPLAAELLGIGKSTLYRKLKEYNINQ